MEQKQHLPLTTATSASWLHLHLFPFLQYPLRYVHAYIHTHMHTYIVVPSVCRAFRPLVPEVHRYKGRHGVEPWSLYLHTYIHTYTLLSGRRFFSCMTGDGNGNEDGDNPTHVWKEKQNHRCCLWLCTHICTYVHTYVSEVARFTGVRTEPMVSWPWPRMLDPTFPLPWSLRT